MFEAQPGCERDDDVVDDHQKVPQIFLVNDAVNGDGQRADHPVFEQLQSEQFFQIQADFKIEVTLKRLNCHTAKHQQ